MNTRLLKYTRRDINPDIELSASKSIVNRMLIIKELSGNSFSVSNLPDSDDCVAMVNALQNQCGEINIGHAGTTMRFLTSYFSAKDGAEVLLTGSKRMQERPIGVLVDALRSIGASIEYAKSEGCPPLKITGKTIDKNIVKIRGDVSSQYISSLLLIAPTLRSGLTVEFTSELISKPYVNITTSLMQRFGAVVEEGDGKIVVKSGKYVSDQKEIVAEGDWSSASYIYQLVSLIEGKSAFIKGMDEDSLQGDSDVVKMFSKLGVVSEFKNGGVYLENRGNISLDFFEYDFISTPDVAQTLAVTLVSKKIPFRLKGLQTLRIKETDRIEALQTELRKFGAELTEPVPGTLEWNGEFKDREEDIIVHTYNDHRMAMAFAPAAIFFNNVSIQNPEVVSKSYKNYWNDISLFGIS